VDRNTYSIPSWLIGEKVEVRLYVEHVEVCYAQKETERIPRLRGRGQHAVRGWNRLSPSWSWARPPLSASSGRHLVSASVERACQSVSPTSDSLLRLFEEFDQFGLVQGLEKIVGRSQLQSIAEGVQR